MTTEEKLRAHIIHEFGSLLRFTKESGIAYGTLQGVLNRGVQQSSITVMIRICQFLHISLDDLIQGNIVPSSDSEPIEMSSIFGRSVALDGITLSQPEMDILRDCIETASAIIRRKRT